jgi:hypothetical protein
MAIINPSLVQSRLNAMRRPQKPIVAPAQMPSMQRPVQATPAPVQKPMQAAPAPMPASSQMPVPAKPIVAPVQAPLMQQPVQATPPSLPASPARPVQPQPQPQANYGGAQDSGFNNYGFDRNLVDYLNKQKKLSTFDAGISYSYDPATQTFNGGTMSGPIKKTLQQMQTESQKTPLIHFKKGGRVKVAQDTKKKYTSGGKINLNECGVSTAPKGKKNSNW